MITALAINAKTLIVYYSYTNHVHTIATELQAQTGADIIRIEPAEKGLRYEANNYALGTQLLNAIRANPNDASSYPAIDPVDVDLSQYDVVLIGAPLWWSQMAAPLQTYLFNNRAALAGKKIGLIVSSASSGISGVEADARRLIPGGDFLTPSLWIRSSQTSGCRSMIQNWLQQIDYPHLSAIEAVESAHGASLLSVHTFDGKAVNASNFAQLSSGLYVVRHRLADGSVATRKFIK